MPTPSTLPPTARLRVDQVGGTDYDLVILDVLLPRINGLELCRQICVSSARPCRS